MQSIPASQFQTALDNSRLTRPMWMLWMLSAGLIALDGFDFFIIGVAMPFIQRDFALSASWVGAIATSALLGALVGSLTLGPVTDRIGRQKMLVVDIALFVVASLATAIAWNAWSLLIFRFLVGVGIGADYPISVAYITENVPARHRGRMVIGAFSFQAVGALLGALVGWVTILVFQQLAPDMAVSYAWRWMLGVGVALSVLVGGLRLLFLLESPSYYLTKGDYLAASAAASELLEKEITLKPGSQVEGSNEVGNPQQASDLGYRDLFAPAYRQQTALAAIPWFLQDIATYGIGIFTPTIITVLTRSEKVSVGLSESGRFLAQEIASAQGAAIVNIFLVVGFGLAVLSINRVGRIPLQMTGFIGMAVGLCILSLSGSRPQLAVLFLGFILFNLSMNLGPNATTFLLSGEVFPPAIRASGAGLAGAIAKSGAIIGALALPVLQETIGIVLLLQSLALICLLAALITFLLRRAVPDIETREKEASPEVTKDVQTLAE